MKKSFGRILWASLRGRCPRCEQGHVLKTPFTLKEKCPACGVCLERSPGEGTGAMMLTLSLIPLPVIVVAMALILQPGSEKGPIIFGAVALVIVACLVFYPLARSLWLGITYLFGDLLTDEEYEARRLK